MITAHHNQTILSGDDLALCEVALLKMAFDRHLTTVQIDTLHHELVPHPSVPYTTEIQRLSFECLLHKGDIQKVSRSSFSKPVKCAWHVSLTGFQRLKRLAEKNTIRCWEFAHKTTMPPFDHRHGWTSQSIKAWTASDQPYLAGSLSFHEKTLSDSSDMSFIEILEHCPVDGYANLAMLDDGYEISLDEALSDMPEIWAENPEKLYIIESVNSTADSIGTGVGQALLNHLFSASQHKGHGLFILTPFPMQFAETSSMEFKKSLQKLKVYYESIGFHCFPHQPGYMATIV